MNKTTTEERRITQMSRTDEVVEIDLRELWYLFLRKIWIILLCAIVGGAGAGLYTHYRIPKRYQSTSTLYIVSASENSLVNLSDLNLGSSLTQDYAELIKTRPLCESVAKNLGLNMSPSTISGMISISNPSNTRVLKITVTSTNPQLAMDIANEVARISVTWLSEIMEMNEPNIVEEAVLPTSPVSPDMKRNILVGAFALAVLYFGIVAAVYVLDDTVRSADEFEKYFGFVPLASIPEEHSIRKATTKHKRKKYLGGSRSGGTR